MLSKIKEWLCLHDFELIGKACIKPFFKNGRDTLEIKHPSILEVVATSPLYVGSIEYLFKCKKCPKIFKQVLLGVENPIENNRGEYVGQCNHV